MAMIDTLKGSIDLNYDYLNDNYYKLIPKLTEILYEYDEEEPEFDGKDRCTEDYVEETEEWWPDCLETCFSYTMLPTS